MLRVFRSRAGLFVAVGWLLFLVSIPICLAIGAMAGLNAFYFPTHQAASLDAFDAKVSEFALALGAFGAVASSIMLALKFRTTASALVVTIWGLTLLGIPTARLFVQPGPEYFERHLGRQVFLVPWQYAPGGFGSTHQDSHEIGFSTHLCISNLKGAYENDCRDGEQLYIVQREWAFREFEIDFWRTRSSQMRAGPERNGYQSYAYDDTFPAGSDTQVVTYYFVRQDSEGRITRFVVCRLNSESFCSHHTLLENFGLRYDAPLTEGDALDGKLASLVDSWRLK